MEVLNNYLVTGSAGFIGSNFVKFMLEKYDNIKIVSFDKLTYAGSLANLNSLKNDHNHSFIQGDICDKKLVDSLLRDMKINKIVHFAAESHVDKSIKDPSEFVHTNVLGTFQLLESARQYWINVNGWTSAQCRFHHISTDEVYGTLKPNDAPFKETNPYAPNSPYSASKAGSDHLVRAYFHTYGLPVTISNCSNNYGPFQHFEKLIPTVIRSCLERKSIPVYGDGSNIRDWLFVDDHCSAIDNILLKGRIGEVYNVGGNCELSNILLVEKICKIMDKIKPIDIKYSNLISFVTDRPGHDWRYAIDNSKIQNELGWSPVYSLEVGLEATIKYYLNKGFLAE